MRILFTRTISTLIFLSLMPISWAAAPSDLWGYYPGQSAEDALSVDTERQLEVCDFKGVWKCISFAKNLFGHYAKIHVQLSEAKKVKRIVINASTSDQTERTKCSTMAIDIMFRYREIYGPYEEEKTTFYTVHWRSSDRHLSLTAICVSEYDGVLVGGLE